MTRRPALQQIDVLESRLRAVERLLGLPVEPTPAERERWDRQVIAATSWRSRRRYRFELPPSLKGKAA